MTTERQGELFIGTQTVFWGFFPIITALSYASVPPLASLGISIFFATCFFAIVMTFKKLWKELRNMSALHDMLFVVLFNGVGYYGFYFYALKYTSVGNAAILSLTELFFSYLFFHVWKKEELSFGHLFGSCMMVLGAGIILSSGWNSFHAGDIFIIIAAMCAPMGNFYQLKARKKISSESMMFIRSLLSVPIILGLSLLLSEHCSIPDIRSSFWLLLLNGAIILGFSKYLWLEGIHRISITKALAIGLGSGPLITLIAAFFILKQTPTIWQLTSLIPIGFGIYFLTRQPVKELEIEAVNS